MLTKGSVVKSLAGRDRDSLLLVTDVSESGIFVCDGKERPLERPKLKNPRHLSDTGMRLETDSTGTNRALRKVLAELSFAGSNLKGV